MIIRMPRQARLRKNFLARRNTFEKLERRISQKPGPHVAVCNDLLVSLALVAVGRVFWT